MLGINIKKKKSATKKLTKFYDYEWKDYAFRY